MILHLENDQLRRCASDVGDGPPGVQTQASNCPGAAVVQTSTRSPAPNTTASNQPTPPAFRESVRVGEQNLYIRAKELVGDRNPREEEFSIQMRAMDADKTGAGLGLPVLVALCGALLARNTRGGTILVGALNLGGSVEMIPNAIRIAELAIDKASSDTAHACVRSPSVERSF
jgi:ATP-dependent Lon protease